MSLPANVPTPAPEAPSLRIAPPGFLDDPGLRLVLAALPGARLVGGCVRDALAGHDVADFDLATPLVPDAAIAALHAAGLKAVPTGVAHGTVTAVAVHRGYEVTTLRRDVETDGRHAVVAFTLDWREDAARRDFTINAMSMTADGAVYDYFGGLADLSAGRVRFVGDAALRIAEDYLRVLRFFRFFARYGRGEPDPAAMAAISEAVAEGGLSRLSMERVWSELKRILTVEQPDAVVALMRERGVWDAILPGVCGTPCRTLAKLPRDAILRLAAFRPGDIAGRMRLSNEEAARLAALRGSPPPEEADDDTLRRLLADTPRDILVGRAWLAGAPEALRTRIAAMPEPRFPLRGRDLRAAGVSPGPAMGEMLRDLREWWMAGGCIASAPEIRAELARRRSGC